MLHKLFISKVRVKMLEQFLFNEGQEFHVRGLVRIMDEEINAVRRELQNLEEAGILISQKKGNKLFYRIDNSFNMLEELRSMLYKDRSDFVMINDAIKKIVGIKIALLTQNYITNSYENDIDIDLLLVGDFNVNEVTAVLKKLEKELDRVLRVTAMKQKDLEFHQKKRDLFLLNILQNDKIFLIGSNKDLA